MKMTSAPAWRHALPARNRFIKSHDGAGIRARNDHKLRVASRRTGGFDLFDELPPVDDLFAFIVATALGRHLILNMDTRGADGFHLAHSAHQVDGIAIAGIRIGQDG